MVPLDSSTPGDKFDVFLDIVLIECYIMEMLIKYN